MMSAEDMARVAYLRFKRGNWVIVAGWFNWLVALGVRFVPGILLIPRSAGSSGCATPKAICRSHGRWQNRRPPSRRRRATIRRRAL